MNPIHLEEREVALFTPDLAELDALEQQIAVVRDRVQRMIRLRAGRDGVALDRRTWRIFVPEDGAEQKS